MPLSVEDMGPHASRLVLGGRLDADGVARIELTFTANACSGARHVLVDLGGVEFIASLGLRMLISTARMVQQRGRVMVLYNATPAVSEVLATVALDRMLPVVPDEAEALARLPAAA